MMYSEFIQLAKINEADMSPTEYAETVEVVYMWHPVIKDSTGKKQIVELFKMGLVRDLLPRAKQIMELEQLVSDGRRQLKNMLTEQERERNDLELYHRKQKIEANEKLDALKSQLADLR